MRFAAPTLARPKRAATLARSAEPAHRRFVSSQEGSLLHSDPGSKTFRVVAATRRFRRVALAAIARVACTLGTSRHPQVSAAPEVTSWERRTQTSPHPSPADRGDFGGTEGNSSFGSGRSLWSMRSRRDTYQRSPLNDAIGLPGWGGQSRSFRNCLLFPGESVAHNRRLTAVPTRVLRSGWRRRLQRRGRRLADPGWAARVMSGPVPSGVVDPRAYA